MSLLWFFINGVFAVKVKNDENILLLACPDFQTLCEQIPEEWSLIFYDREGDAVSVKDQVSFDYCFEDWDRKGSLVFVVGGTAS